jgi:hypothetical protein
MLQRPCVYCSILLFVLVFSLFDFHADWFEPRWQPSTTRITSSLLSGNSTVTELASFAIAAINGTGGGSLASAALESVRKRNTNNALITGLNENGFEVLRSVMERRQFRIPCLGVNVRL